jgi:hypothetical protein
MRRSYVVPMRWTVIYEYEVPGGALNLNYTKLPRPWSPRGSSPSRKNPHGRTGNRTRELMISSQKLWPLDHEAGHKIQLLRYSKCKKKTVDRVSYLCFSLGELVFHIGFRSVRVNSVCNLRLTFAFESFIQKLGNLVLTRKSNWVFC